MKRVISSNSMYRMAVQAMNAGQCHYRAEELPEQVFAAARLHYPDLGKVAFSHP